MILIWFVQDFNSILAFFKHNLQMSAKFQTRVKTAECVQTRREVTLVAVNLVTAETTVKTVMCMHLNSISLVYLIVTYFRVD